MGLTPARCWESSNVWAPYATLAIGTLMALATPDAGSVDRVVLLAMVAGATAWVAGVGRAARMRGQTWLRGYFAGLIVCSAMLMLAHPLMFVVPIAAFFGATELRPAPVMFAGVAATSLIVNGLIVYPNPSTQGWWIYGVVVVVQTLSIGFGVIGSQKLTELSEQRRRNVEALEAAMAENAGLHAQLVVQAREAGVTDERERMAREIHDTIAQGLTGIITQLEAARGVTDDPADLDRRLGHAMRLARDSLAEARRSVRAIRPLALQDRRLPDALADIVGRWSTVTGVSAELSTTGTIRELHPEVEVTLLRVTQEALANVDKHAGASRVGVTLSYMGDVAAVDVRDDGAGFDATGLDGAGLDDPGVDTAGPSVTGRGSNGGDGLLGRGGAALDRGFGLTGMRQRVASLAGHLQVESEPGRGTAVSASLPALGVAPVTPERTSPSRPGVPVTIDGHG